MNHENCNLLLCCLVLGRPQQLNTQNLDRMQSHWRTVHSCYRWMSGNDDNGMHVASLLQGHAVYLVSWNLQ